MKPQKFLASLICLLCCLEMPCHGYSQGVHEIYELSQLELHELIPLIPLMNGIGSLDYPINSVRISNRFVHAGTKASLDAIDKYLESGSGLPSPSSRLARLPPILFPIEKQNVLRRKNISTKRI